MERRYLTLGSVLLISNNLFMAFIFSANWLWLACILLPPIT